MKKILFLILASVLSVGLHAQTSNYGHAASLGSNAADAGGDIVGPGSSTNNAFARFSGTTGKLLQDTPDLTYSSPTMSAPDGFVLSLGRLDWPDGGGNESECDDYAEWDGDDLIGHVWRWSVQGEF